MSSLETFIGRPRAWCGEALRQARFARAGQVVGINQATSADPFQAILGRPSQANAQNAILGTIALAAPGPIVLFNSVNTLLGRAAINNSGSGPALTVDIEVLGACADGSEALAAIRKQAPDLVFMDVEMPGLNGFATI